MAVHAAKNMGSGSEAHAKQIGAVNSVFKRLNGLGTRNLQGKNRPIFLSMAIMDKVGGKAYRKRPFLPENLLGEIVSEVPINYLNARETTRFISKSVAGGMCVAERNGNIYVIKPALA